MSLWGKGHFLWALRTQCTAPIPVLPESGGPRAAQSIFCEPCTLPTSAQLWFLPGPTSNMSYPWGTGHFLWALSIHCTAPTSTQLWFLPGPTWNMSSPWGTGHFLWACYVHFLFPHSYGSCRALPETWVLLGEQGIFCGPWVWSWRHGPWQWWGRWQASGPAQGHPPFPSPWKTHGHFDFAPGCTHTQRKTHLPASLWKTSISSNDIILLLKELCSFYLGTRMIR